MELALNLLLNGATSGDDASSDSTSIIDWDDPPMSSDNEDIFGDNIGLSNTRIQDQNDPFMPSDNEDIFGDNIDLSKNDNVEEASMPIQDQNDKLVKPNNDTNKDITEDTNLPENDGVEEENGFEAKLKEHEEAIKPFDEWSADAEDNWDEWTGFVEENLGALRKGFENVSALTKALGRLTRLHEDMADSDYYNFKADIQALQEGQESIKAEIEGGKTTLKNYAKENESLKDKINDLESKITALMAENLTFKLQIGSLLYTIRSLEDKVDRLHHNSPNRDKSTE